MQITALTTSAAAPGAIPAYMSQEQLLTRKGRIHTLLSEVHAATKHQMCRRSMADLGAFKAAVTACRERQDEGSRAEALRLFDALEPWQQESILDFATVASVHELNFEQTAFGSVWQRWPGVDSEAWFTELQQCGLAVTDPDDLHNTCGLIAPLAEMARSILLDPQSRYFGSRLWMQNGVVNGAQQVSSHGSH